jgi:hypothetical protein
MQVTTQAYLVYCLNSLCVARDLYMIRSYQAIIKVYSILKENFKIHMHKTLK